LPPLTGFTGRIITTGENISAMLSGFFRLEPFTATQQVILNNNSFRRRLL
ncbi:hypothetical protein HCX44_24680, partial [Escherichia coli]|nr:hypothetical protein [Escherichia coli]